MRSDSASAPRRTPELLAGLFALASLGIGAGLPTPLTAQAGPSSSAVEEQQELVAGMVGIADRRVGPGANHDRRALRLLPVGAAPPPRE